MKTAQETRSEVGRRARDEFTSYYGRPVIKEPVWTPEIPIYFFTGGLAGASAGLSLLARLTGRRKLARAATGNAFLGIAVSPVLLISDLGVPARFLNMLRVFKVTSPMSVGSWILSVEGGLVTLSAADEFLGVVPKPIARVARILAALFGMPLATYTAALVANTAVPVWHDGRQELPFAFAGGSAMAAGGAAALLAPRQASPARRLAIFGAVLEFASLELSKKKLGMVGEVYKTGVAGQLDKAGSAVTLGAAAALAAAEATRSRKLGVVGSLLALAGSMLARWTVFKGGFQSAAAPQYTVEPQRERVTQTR